MRAITISEPGGPEVLRWTGVPDPRPGEGEVLVRVAASAVNRADLLQRKGLYAPPPGTTEVPGLECSGVVTELGSGVSGWQVGDRVCALLAGGGYAEQVVVPAGQLLPVPSGVDLVEAAGLPEVACTVWSNVVQTGRLTAGETLLVHGGAGGIGTHAIQVGKALGATVAVTAGSAERLSRCADLGADTTLDYRETAFEDEVRADVILDNMGAKYLRRNITALNRGGRLVVIGMQGGTIGELDLSVLLRKNATIAANSLRYRPVAEKAAIVAEVVSRVWPMVADGRVRPVTHAVLPITEAGEAHRMLDAGGVFGKLVLAVDS
ncbi:NAD(P)H-quinone oxidoreductase [Actinokineospora globicatena]|uniref:NAD(P)H-quinone oxidoreductase n=1 Tax=Actinokineospora globicatena TaxID=103729 RepID=UPI0020A49BA1|nr:NAD(P)H-quinone oxidoreductase [Actinokineospora globicatena]MCP2301085.1 putative NAD(P)H quinone oxidoreductase, PIG3 family [Actinokineospora globicatena]GLW77279.1 NAD(P)H quinone oxidoreductase [Actinokineospora globicatena]GLW84113.1 NAD(P)H quinone oxidoreductase [Actinokineospora globicatena]